LPQLKHLKLWQAEGINDSAVPALLKFERLEVLELPETNVTSEGLSQLAGNKSLKQLYLGGVSLTAEQVETVRKAMPECLVSWWEKPKIEAPQRGRRGGN
jgi:hypothetical protein